MSWKKNQLGEKKHDHEWPFYHTTKSGLIQIESNFRQLLKFGSNYVFYKAENIVGKCLFSAFSSIQ